jgi:hypothetical protein
MDWRESYHVTCILCGRRYATIELCFLCVVRAERIWENTGIRTDFTWVAKFQGNSSVARRRIRRLRVWRYMCCSYSHLESVRIIVVTTSEDPINRFTNLSHWNTWQYGSPCKNGVLKYIFRCLQYLHGFIYFQIKCMRSSIILKIWIT